MKLKLLFSITILTFVFTTVNAQNLIRCASTEYQQQQVNLNPGLQQIFDQEDLNAAAFVANHQDGFTPQVICTIPVVFHVLYSSSAQNISNTRLTDQIAVLNKDFRKLNTDANLIPSVWQSIAADCEIQFCLAQRDPNGIATTGIERIQTSTTSWGLNDAMKFASSGGANAWNRSKYLNIWVCNLSGGILGFAISPGGPASTDGVVLGYQYVGVVGATAPFNKGRTATHEIGHWLNMKHIWGDDGNACTGSDFVNDTPNQAGENYGCPSFPHTDNCTPAAPGVMTMNYMDYTDDACMYMFTSGQKTRMWATLNGTRSSIKTSNGCTPSTVGISEELMQNMFSINPTPTDGAFTLNFGNGSPANFDVSIYNILGEVIFQQHYSALNENELHLNLDGNTAGIYLIEVRTTNGRTVKKIILN